MAVATYNAQVSKVNRQRQLGANGVYQMAETVASAPDGRSFPIRSIVSIHRTAAALEGGSI